MLNCELTVNHYDVEWMETLIEGYFDKCVEKKKK